MDTHLVQLQNLCRERDCVAQLYVDASRTIVIFTVPGKKELRLCDKDALSAVRSMIDYAQSELR